MAVIDLLFMPNDITNLITDLLNEPLTLRNNLAIMFQNEFHIFIVVLKQKALISSPNTQKKDLSQSGLGASVI